MLLQNAFTLNLLLSISLAFVLTSSSITQTTSFNLMDNFIAQLFDNLTKASDDLTNPNMWPKDFADELLAGNRPFTHDYIVVGAGSAGSVVASRLSEDPNVSVLLLEAGEDPPSLSEVFTLSMLLKNTTYTWNDYAEPSSTSCMAMKGGRCYWLRGRMVSGTGGINGNVFLIGHPDDYDDWHQQGNPGWSWQDIYPYFVTEDQSTPDKPKGSLVLNHFLRPEDFHILNELMTNGTQEVEADFSIKSLGFRRDIMATVDRGKRMSTGKTYLGKVAPQRPNLHVVKNAVVKRVLFNQHKKAVGVEVVLRGLRTLKLAARQEIILSAGAFNSPKILMLSGIGPCGKLKTQGINCITNLPVGRNLQDHGMMALNLKFNKNIPATQTSDTLQNTFEYLAYQKGPLASHTHLVGFINSLAAENINRTDLMLVSGISKPSRDSNMYEFLEFRDDLVERYLEQTENHTVLEIQGLLIKPKSRSHIELKSPDFLKGPLIYSNFAAEEEDRRALLGFIRFVQKLANSSIFSHYGLELVRIPLDDCDLLPYDTDDYWLCFIKYFYISAWHAAGTCRMGPASDASAVVDSQLRVHGVKDLRVIDASIMPNITSGNVNGPTIMIAEKGAQMIRDQRGNSIEV